MWLSSIDETSEAWFSLEPLVLIHPYKSVQIKLRNALLPYLEILERYSESTEQSIGLVSNEYLSQQPHLIEQNVALLKNAIELWKTATRVSDSIAPILLHYSWHCFNSFFIYSLLKWEPPHAKSHGIKIDLSDRLMEIEIEISETGLFRRLIDTFAVIGTSLVFSRVLPSVKNGKVEFVPNNNYLPDKNGRITLKQLLEFDPIEYEKRMYESRRDTLVSCPFLANSIYLPNRLLQVYLILFVTSSIARYRPILWHSILVGESQEESDFALKSSLAALDYTLGQHRDLGFVSQVTRILSSAEKGTFVLKSADGRQLR